MRTNGLAQLILPFLVLSFLIAPTASAQGAEPASAAALDTVWILVAAALVFLMQGGFALLGAGALRGKNVVNYLTKSVMDFGFGALAFFTVGFGLMFGAGNPWIGLSDFGLGATMPDGGTLAFFLFQVMFAATAATIVAGAVAERMKIRAYILYSIVITAVLYPIFGHWVWGGGFLSSLPWGAGAVDFAGSGVVHGIGGLLALVAAALLGPRLGRYDEHGTPRPMPGHNLTYVVLGTVLLFFGWFGFNAGSTLSASDPLIPLIATNTFLAGCAGAVTVFVLQASRGPTGIATICNGMLSGLVAITAPCAFVAPWAAILIGAAGGAIYLAGTWWLVHRLRIDDPVGAIPVHGFNGVWGLLAVGIFADGTGGVVGLVGGSAAQLVSQGIAAGVLLAWGLGAGYVLFKTVDVTIGLRVDETVERDGLDTHEHKSGAYPELAAVLTSQVVPGKKR